MLRRENWWPSFNVKQLKVPGDAHESVFRRRLRRLYHDEVGSNFCGYHSESQLRNTEDNIRYKKLAQGNWPRDPRIICNYFDGRQSS